MEVANAYTSFFRVTSLFKDPSLYGRYLVVPIAVLLVAILVRRGRTIDWVVATGFVAFLFLGLFYSYSQSSFVALFVVTFAVAVVGADGRTRIVLLACAVVATLAAASVAGAAIGGRSAKDVTSGRSRLVDVTVEAFKERPIAGVGIGGQPKASSEIVEKGLTEPQRISHDTAHGARRARRDRLRTFCLAARRGRVGALSSWRTGTACSASVSRRSSSSSASIHCSTPGSSRAPLTWGVIGLACAALARASSPSEAAGETTDGKPAAPEPLAH